MAQASKTLKTKCESCGKVRADLKTAYVDGKYYKAICGNCLSSNIDEVSSNAAGYNRRRDYEDFAQDTIQPYDANGKPRSEFYRLYPQTAKKVFSPAEIEQVKRKI